MRNTLISEAGSRRCKYHFSIVDSDMVSTAAILLYQRNESCSLQIGHTTQSHGIHEFNQAVELT